MTLLQVFTVVLTQFSVGSLLMTSLLPTREIRVGFFTLNSLMSAIAAALALVFTKFAAGAVWWDTRYLGLTVIGATLAYGAFKLERMQLGRMLLILSGLIGLFFGLLPLGAQSVTASQLKTTAPYLFDATILAGALLFGATHVGMILGHWYLLMRRLSFEYLNQFAKLVLFAVCLRGLILVVTLTTISHLDPRFAGNFLPRLYAVDGDLFFFVFRVLFGVAVPLVLGFMVLRCVQLKNNQAATGLLYVAEISVLFGELFAAKLLV
ncbi:MAG: hypothetical protein K8R48_00780 [Alphaproteobacteria bacterium]|nr:hypothetical protein [Alphaproteobacteria bacterium]